MKETLSLGNLTEKLMGKNIVEQVFKNAINSATQASNLATNFNENISRAIPTDVLGGNCLHY